jgi:protein-S-isoprenylcysteine O-methyltransferase Ste14
MTERLLRLQALLRAAAPALVALATATVLAAVALNFMLARPAAAVRSERRSAVATGTMLGFFALLFLLLRFQLGAVRLSPWLADLLLDAGLGLVLLGAGVNVAGRLTLGGLWGNHVVLYRDHALVCTGVFRWVRHPLYASLIWMAAGAACVFGNPAALAATLGIFLPAMVFRARQEEAALSSLFPGYAAYRRRTGMLVPRPWSHR